MARFTRARKLGRDQEEDRNELKETIDDPDSTFADILACAIEIAPPEQQSEVMEALREIGEDRRGARSWAKDRREMYRHARDQRGPENAIAEGANDRRMAHDAAHRRQSARQEFNEWFPEAAKITR
jgi:hypothetical protein